MFAVVILANREYGWNRHIWDIPLNLLPSQTHPISRACSTTTAQLSVFTANVGVPTGTGKIAFAAKIVFTLAATFTRLSLLCFYYRLVKDSGIRWFRHVIWSSMVFVVAICIAFVALVIWQCKYVSPLPPPPFITLPSHQPAHFIFPRLTSALPPSSPIHAYWTFPPMKNSTCLDEGKVTLAAGVINCFADLLVTTLPIPIILKLQMPVRQRIGAILLLSLGFVVTIAGVVRTYYIWKSLMDSYDETWFSYPLWIAAAVEIDLAVVRLCLCRSLHLPSPLFLFLFL